MVQIVFEPHSTTVDNQNKVASGHFDVELSELGVQQAKELGGRYSGDYFDAIFCSDLQRSYKTAELAFAEKFPIIKDSRLRECDYGDLTRQPSSIINSQRAERVTKPFPSGESYEQTTKRMGEFLTNLLRDYGGKRVMIIGHRATQYGLEHWIKGVPIEEAVTAPWQWQPGWSYELEELQ